MLPIRGKGIPLPVRRMLPIRDKGIPLPVRRRVSPTTLSLMGKHGK